MGGVRKCYVCGNTTNQAGNIFLHRFPNRLDKEKVFKQWLYVLDLNESDVVSKRMTVCSEHFTRNDYVNKNPRAKLWADAVPSVRVPNKLLVPEPADENMFPQMQQVSGCPAPFPTENDPDWAPSLRLGGNSNISDHHEGEVEYLRLLRTHEMENSAVIQDVAVKEESGDMDNLGMFHEVVVKEEHEWMQSLGDTVEVAVKEEPVEIENEGLHDDFTVKEELEEVENLEFSHKLDVKEELEEVETKPLARVDVFPDDEECLEDLNAEDPLAFVGEREDNYDSSPQPEDTIEKRCLNNIQQVQRRFKCKICGKAFKRTSHLNSHLRSHTRDRHFICDLCGKAFKRSSHLNSHLRSHTRDRHFICDLCGKAFTKPSDLMSHKRTHTGERPFICDVCGKAFTKPSDLVCHKRTHTGERPFTCDVCGKAFKSSSNLSAHFRSHIGEKPHICTVCSKGFSSASNLSIHLRRTHNGDRPYSCKVCGKTFLRSTTLSYHRKKHSHDEDLSSAESTTSDT